MTDVVSPEWVATHPDVHRIDVRDGWEYDGIGHLPGAVNVPFDSFRAEEHAAESGGGDGMLPGSDVFSDLMSAAGVGTDEDLVAYDDTHGVFAARLLVTCELYGHDPDALHLLDGDFSAWQREREVSGETPDPEPVPYEANRIDGPLVDADAVAAAAEAPDAVVVDTREDWEYEEGHVPGAVRLDWRELVDDDTRGILGREAALDVLADRGIVSDKRVVLYCNTARRISHTYVVLRHLEFPDVAFYEGSLTEWEAQGRPLETAD